MLLDSDCVLWFIVCMTTNGEDRIDLLKEKYLKQIDVKQTEIAAIRQKLSILEELKAEVNGLVLFKEADGSPVKLAPTDNHLFVATGLTDAVMKSISWFGTKPFSPPMMRQCLLNNGFKPSGKNFNVSVGTTLKRLADQGRILKETVNDKPVYKAKP